MKTKKNTQQKQQNFHFSSTNVGESSGTISMVAPQVLDPVPFNSIASGRAGATKRLKKWR